MNRRLITLCLCAALICGYVFAGLVANEKPAVYVDEERQADVWQEDINTYSSYVANTYLGTSSPAASSNLSDYNNDAGFLTAESDDLADVMGRDNDANDIPVSNTPAIQAQANEPWVDVDDGILYDNSGNGVVQWNDAWLYDFFGNKIMDWNEGIIWSTEAGATTSIYFKARQLFDLGETKVMDWDEKDLYGQWTLDHVATEGQDIVTYSVLTNQGYIKVSAKDATFIQPQNIAAVTTNMPLFSVETAESPNGIVVTDCFLKTSASSTYNVDFEVWSAPTTYSSKITDLGTSASLEASTNISVSVGAGNIVFLEIPTNILNWITVKVCYTNQP